MWGIQNSLENNKPECQQLARERQTPTLPFLTWPVLLFPFCESAAGNNDVSVWKPHYLVSSHILYLNHSKESHTPTETHKWGHTVHHWRIEHTSCVTSKTMNDVTLKWTSDTDPETVTTCGSCLSEPPAAAGLGLLIVRFIIAIMASTTWRNWRAWLDKLSDNLDVVYDCVSLLLGNILYLVTFEREKQAENPNSFPGFILKNSILNQPQKKRKKTTTNAYFSNVISLFTPLWSRRHHHRNDSPCWDSGASSRRIWMLNPLAKHHSQSEPAMINNPTREIWLGEMEAGESEGMSHGNVAVIRTRRDGKSRERSMLIRKEGRFP